MNEKLQAIAAKAAENLQAYVREHEDKILEAWNNAEQEAQDNETKPKFRLGYTITLDLDDDAMETALSWSVRFKASSTGPIPETDDSQSDLFDRDGDKLSQTVTSAVKNFSKVLKGAGATVKIVQ